MVARVESTLTSEVHRCILVASVVTTVKLYTLFKSSWRHQNHAPITYEGKQLRSCGGLDHWNELAKRH